jgi:hypothetical protein
MVDLMTMKFLQIAQIIQRRIDEGEYSGGTLEGLRILADELGVSYLTVRKALHHLCKKGLLEASNNKRFKIVESKRPSPEGGKYAIILPIGALNTGFPDAISKAVNDIGGTLKRYFYGYYEDEIISTTIEGDFDLIFFHIDLRKTPQVLVDKIVENKSRMVSIIFDYTDKGLRILAETDIAASIKLLLKILLDRGHKRLDILGIAHDNEIIAKRIKFAEKYSKKLGLKHTCIHKTVPEFSYEFDIASELAHQLYGGGIIPDAIFVPTVYTAMAVMRALKNKGLLAGKDYSLASCEDLMFAKYCPYSITVSYTPDTTSLVKNLIKCHNNNDFSKLIFQPPSPLIFEGETVIKK